MKQERILDVRNLNVFFKTQAGRLNAIEGLNFHVNQGEILGIVGESGCGKSVTSLAVMGLIEQPGGYTADAIEFQGQDISKFSAEQRRKLRGSGMSMIFQEPLTSLNPLLTVGNQLFEQVKIHTPGISKADCKARCIEMLRKTGIPDPEAAYKNYPAFLSGGMRQRVMIAIALACNPALLIADEPTTALDVTIQAQVLAIIEQIIQNLKTTLILITHDLGVVADICQKVAIMYAGEVVEYGTLDHIYNHTLHPYSIGLFESIPNFNESVHRLKPIKGLMPDPTNLPKGCSFCLRCPDCQERCTQEKFPLVEAEPGHFVRCVKYLDSEGGVHVG